MSQRKLQIHTENILPIIKQWLYSDKDIFVRELISNACDALKKLQILRDQGLANVADEDLKIELNINKEARTLEFSDTGIGMTEEEVEKYIAQVAFSGAEEFVSKYTTNNEKDQIIGHFGLGFYSAYMVADSVSLNTLSYQDLATPALWSCDGSSSYTLEEGSRTKRGTTIILHINQESSEFLEEHTLRDILNRYCVFLPFPIFLNGTLINKTEPLWLKSASSATEQDYLDFYRVLYPLDQDPIFWIHLNVDYPFNLKGILYFPKLTRSFDLSKNAIKLFCNRVFVSDNCKDVIPDYLTCLRGALDSPDIPLNVSRSTLQMDHTVKQLSSHISKKVADRLLSLYQTDRDRFLKAWPDIELIVKLGILQDEKFFDRIKDVIVWKNLSGEWVSISDYLARTPDKVLYVQDEHSPLLQLYQNKEVLLATSPIDSTLMNFLESKLKTSFQRIDCALDDSIVDGTREKTLLDAGGKTEGSRIADFIRQILGQEKLAVEAKSLTSDTLPAFLMLDENMRRMRDYMALSQQKLPPSLGEKRTFVVNTNNKLVSSIFALKDSHPDLAKDMVHYLYDLARLSQKELEPASFPEFVARSNKVLEELLSAQLKSTVILEPSSTH
jgi:molecular chaperone HtpG